MALSAISAACAWGAPLAAASRVVYTPTGPGGRMYLFPVSGDGSLQSQSFKSITGDPEPLVVTPDGKWLFVGLGGTSTINRYAVDSSTGLVSALGTTTAGTSPVALAVSPSGQTLFSANSSGSISSFTIGTDGDLTATPGSGTTISNATVDGLAINPAGTRVFVSYATTQGEDRLADFAIGLGSTLIAEHEVTVGDGSGAIAVSPNTDRVYVAEAAAGAVGGYSVGADGALTSLANSPYAAGGGTRALSLSPDGSRLLAANAGAGSVTAFSVGATGELQVQDTETTIAGATAAVVAQDGKHAYIAGNASVGAFDLSQAGALSLLGQRTTVGQHSAIVISPNQPPDAKFNRSPGPAGSASSFQGTAIDSDGSIADWSWDFGDGTTGTGVAPKHVYAHSGTYNVTLTVTDNEGCSTTPVYTGQMASCVGGSTAAQVISIPPPVDNSTPEPPCEHDGNDGFCGTPDQKAPVVSVLGFNDGANIAVIDAPDELVGTVTPDPSNIKEIRLRFTKAAGTIVKKTTVTKKVCRKVKGKKRCTRRPVYKKTCRKVHGKRRCKRKKLVKISDSKVPVCLTVSGTKNYLVRYVCSKVPWVTVNGDTTFRYSLPVALGVGSYAVDVIAVDGAGNEDVLVPGRNHMTFTVVQTPSNQGGGGTGTTGGGSETGSSTPIDDTGSPFG